MQALGLIETEGVLAAIVGLDTMLKAANVELVEKIYVGGGLISVVVTGDVGAVQVAVEAGASAIRTLANTLLVSQHVIPRPQEEIKSIIKSEGRIIDKFFSTDNLKGTKVIKEEANKEIKHEEVEVEEIEENKKTEEKDEREVKGTKDVRDKKLKKEDKEITTKDNKKIDLSNIELKELEDIDVLVNKHGIEAVAEVLKEFKVVELRKLARKYEGFGVKGRQVSTASKEILLMEFKRYYQKDNQVK